MPRMHKGYKDPTLDNAIGSVDKEWRQMASLAVTIREGKCNPSWAEEQSKRFTGIFRRLLNDPISEVRKQAGR